MYAIINCIIRRALDGLKHPDDAQQSRESSHEHTADATLSDREKQILHLIAQMKTNGEIAQTLVISPNTVKTHVSHILRKLHLHDRREAALFASAQPAP